MHTVKDFKQSHATHPRRPRITRKLAGLSVLLLLPLLTVFVLATFTTTVALADSWKGKEATKEGVLHIMNPATPMMENKTVELNELWRIDPQPARRPAGTGKDIFKKRRIHTGHRS